MNYEEKYNNLLGRLKALVSVQPEVTMGCFLKQFPELRESEDEKIRKALIRFHKSTIDIDGIKGADVIDWLEKQAQKPADNQFTPEQASILDKHIDKFLEQKPAWSEEDEHRVKDTIYFLDTAKKHYASTVELDACIDWLKSIRPQKHWKPTEEQLQALADSIEFHFYSSILEKLLEQLKEI